MMKPRFAVRQGLAPARYEVYRIETGEREYAFHYRPVSTVERAEAMRLANSTRDDLNRLAIEVGS